MTADALTHAPLRREEAASPREFMHLSMKSLAMLTLAIVLNAACSPSPVLGNGGLVDAGSDA